MRQKITETALVFREEALKEDAGAEDCRQEAKAYRQVLWIWFIRYRKP